MKVAVGSDHAGFELKQKVKEYLAETGIEVEDVGTVSTESVDYPDFAEKVALEVREGRADRGILMCGTGVGVCIAANKLHGIRAALVSDPEIARLSREHNDANVLCLPGRFIEPAHFVIHGRIPHQGGRFELGLPDRRHFLLHFPARYILAAGLDHVLLAVDHVKIALFVYHAQIAAVHPAVAAAMTHVDRESEPRLERILSEMRTHARAGERG